MGLKDIANNVKLNMQTRKMEWPSYTLSGMFSKIRHILLLLPPVEAVKDNMKYLLDELKNLFPNAKYTLVCHPNDNREHAPSAMKAAGRMSPEQAELSWSGLPRKSFIEKIKNLKADLLIDMSTDKNHYNAYIAACSGVPIRVGNYGSWGNPIYNLEIKTQYLQNEQLILQSIIEVLKSFRA
ncbi:MAG: hypothetical protein GF310_11685, partial [candidate division Zixibacteria bacterium]|nr:hypothetical protein [candidate division Zixibacteria bacterium]